MKKGSFANKMAKKAMEKEDVRRGWEVHCKAYGPILEPAFPDNPQARIHLTAALNMISARNLAGALLKLKALQKNAITNADQAALLFCFALHFETAGNQEAAAACYNQANQCGHNFYLPYLKMGKFYLASRVYHTAEKCFRKAIACLDSDSSNLGSAYTSLASCLTMQHRYEEAWAALENADAGNRAAAEAILHAIRGDADKVAECLDRLKPQGEAIRAAVKKNTDAILAGADPMFFPVSVDEEKLPAFWQWFAGYEAEMKRLLDRQKYDDGLTPVAKQLLITFPFLEEVPNVGLGQNKQGYVVELKDYYAVGIVAAYEKLLAVCPEEIKARWQFVIAH